MTEEQAQKICDEATLSANKNHEKCLIITTFGKNQIKFAFAGMGRGEAFELVTIVRRELLRQIEEKC